MRNLKLINDIKEVNLSKEWVDSEKFNSKDRVVNHAGRNYRLLYKKERVFSGPERFGRIFLGVITVMCTFGFAYLSKSIKHLFDNKETIHFGIREVSKQNLRLDLIPNFSKQEPNPKPMDSPPEREPKLDLDKLDKEKKIPRQLDIRGPTWMTVQQLWSYSKYLGSKHPELLIPNCKIYSIENITKEVLTDCGFGQENRVENSVKSAGPSNKFNLTFVYPEKSEEDLAKTVLAYPFLVTGNHYTLVYVDRQKRTIEFYDSKKDYGNREGNFYHDEIVNELTKLGKMLTEKDPGKTPYTFSCKIQKEIQSDGFQCGPWTLFFLENRLKNPEIDFNQLGVAESKEMIAEYRLDVMRKLIELNQKEPFAWFY